MLDVALARRFAIKGTAGRLAQLAEHLVYTERVGGSGPSPPTRLRAFGASAGKPVFSAKAARRSPKGEDGFAAHNAGKSPHTAKFRPWRLVTYIAFSDERKAIDFERYLKSASGRAFAKKRLR